MQAAMFVGAAGGLLGLAVERVLLKS